jgi:hypothetical protein
MELLELSVRLVAVDMLSSLGDLPCRFGEGNAIQKYRNLCMRFSVHAASDVGSAQNQKRLNRKGEPGESPPLKRYEALPYWDHASYP